MKKKNLFVGLLITLFCLTKANLAFAQTFYKQFGNLQLNEGGQVIIPTNDGNYLVGGYKEDSALVIKISPLGKIIWSTTFKASTGSNVYYLSFTVDGSIIGCGNATNLALKKTGFYFKLNSQGNLLWLRVLNDTRNIYCQRIESKLTNEYLLFCTVTDLGSPTSTDPILIRVDSSNGNIISTSPRYNFYSPVSYIDEIYSTAKGNGDFYYATGRSYFQGSSTPGMRPTLSKFNHLGSIQFSKYLLYSITANARIYGIDINYENDSLVIGYFGDKITGTSANYSVGIIKTDTAANVIWSKDYNITSSTSELSSKVLITNYGYAIVGFMPGLVNKNFFIIAVNKIGNLVWAKSYGTAAVEDVLNTTTPIACSDGSNIYFTGRTTTSNNKTDLVIVKVDSLGNTSCNTGVNIFVSITTNPNYSNNCTISTATDNIVFTSVTNSNQNTVIDPCSTSLLNLGKDTSICDSIVLNATMTGANQYLWSNGSTQPTIKIITPGTYWVNVFSNCCLYTDTIHVLTSFNIPAPTISGNTTICSGDSTSLLVNGGSTYLWNNGLTDSLIVVKPVSTTMYTVVAKNGSCTSVPDTVVVNVQQAPNFFLTGDTISCNGGPVQLVAVCSTVSTTHWSPGILSTNDTITVSSNIPGYFSAYVFDGTCTSQPDSIWVDTLSSPKLSATFNPLNCIYDTVHFTAITNGINLAWNFGNSSSGTANTSNLSNPTHSFSTSGNFPISLVAQNFCGSTSYASQITIQSGPIVNLTSDTTICLGASINLQASGGTNYQWSGAATSTNSSIQVSPFVQSNYIVKASNGLCFGEPDTITVYIVPVPTVSLAGDTSVCSGSSAQLIATTVGGTLFQWSSPISSTNDSVQVNPTSTTTYYVSASNGSCSSPLDSFVVSIQAFPVPAFTAQLNPCALTPINFTNNSVGSTSNSWTFGDPGSGILNTSTAANPTHTYSSAATYQVSLTTQNSCGAVSITLPVTIQIGPAVSVLDSVSICIGQQTTLAASGGTSYQWSGASTSTNSSIVVSPIIQSTYFVKTSNGLCFGEQDTVTVYILSTPTVSLTGDSVSCNGNSVQLIAASTGATNLIWGSPITSFNDTIIISPTAQTTYYVTASNGLCLSSTDSLVVLYKTSPSPSFQSPNPLCVLTPLNFTNTTSGLASYSWNFGDPTSLALNTSTLQNPSHGYATPGTYQVTLNAQNSCGSASINHTLSIQSGPNVTLGKDTTICSGNSIILSVSGGSFYQWSGATSSTNASINVAPLIPSTYIVVASDGTCFGIPDTIVVTPTLKPVVSIIGNNTICSGAPVTLSGTGATSYVWSGDISSTSTSITVNPTSTQNYLLTGFKNGCASDPVSFTLTISNPPIANFSYQIDSCSGEINFLNHSIGGNSYLWLYGDGESSNESNPSHYFINSNNYEITLIANPGTFCTDTFKLQIPVEVSETGYIFIPNSFTPNGDGLNDEFIIGANNNCQFLQLEIFNRWGEMIYKTAGYQVKWNGNMYLSQDPTGVYVYLLKGLNFEKIGHLSVLR